MADDSSRASSPEPGEAAPPRGRIIQLKSSSSASRGSMDRQSLESGRSPAYSQWRSGSPPRSRVPRPYSSSGGRGYFKRQSTSYDAGASYQRERVFSRSRGRSVSRSPSRASQHTRSRSRSHSPRSPKSPQRSRSRSRSRSFSPRGHRTFANWERGHNVAAGQYVSGRGRGGFDRQRRERDSWSRGGRGGRYSNYQRGNRFYPKEVRYKTSTTMQHRRSISRDRDSNDGTSMSSSYRDRQMREREYETGYRTRREREVSNRSASLVRSASFSSDHYRESELSASAEEGEEKPEEIHVTTSERSIDSHTPSETGSIDRDITSATDSNSRRTHGSSSFSLPPRPLADSHASSRREGGSPRVADGYGDRSPSSNKEVVTSTRLIDDAEQPEAASSSIKSMEVDERGERREDQCQSTPHAVVKDAHEKVDSNESTVEVLTGATGAAIADEDKSDGKILKGNTIPENQTETGGDSIPNAKETLSEAIGDTDHNAKMGISTNAPSDAVEVSITPDERPQALQSSEKFVVVERKVHSPKENLSVDQRRPNAKPDVDNKVDDCTTADHIISSPGKSENMETEERHEQERPAHTHDVEHISSAPQDDDVDMSAVTGTSSKIEDPDPLDCDKQVAGTNDVEMKNVDGDGVGTGTVQELVPSDTTAIAEQSQTSDSSSVSPIVSVTKEVIHNDIETREVEEGEMVSDSKTSKTTTADHGRNSKAKDDVLASSRSSSLEDYQERKCAVDAVKANASLEIASVGEKRFKIERSRTDPSSDVYSDNSKPRSTSFSSFGLPTDSRREGGARAERKTLFRAESECSLKATRGDKRESYLKQRGDSSPLTHKNSPQRSVRPALDRRASFSTLLERSHSSSEMHQGMTATGYASGSRTVRSSALFSTKSSPPKSHESNTDVRRRGLHDDLKREDAVKRELLRAGSIDSMMDRNPQRSLPVNERAQVVRESFTNASNSPSRRSLGSARDPQLREELPALPNIPLPSSGIRGTSSPTVLGDGTPTKRHRPRLGWGQGLVAPSPPQPAKRPRIGWGQGLMQQKDDTTREKENTSTVVSEGAGGIVDDSSAQVGEHNVGTSTSRDDQHPPIKMETAGTDNTISNSDNKEVCNLEEQTPVISTPEKDNSPKDDTVEEFRTIEVDNVKIAERVEIEQGDAAAPTKPSKEEILSTIDILDSDIAGVKKQIKALQRTIASTAVKKEASLQPIDMEIVSSGELNSANASSKVGRDSPNSLTEQPLLTSPVKVAVDAKFVELLAGVFSENLRKTITANEQLPKRIERGQLATKIYHQPSDYAFYQDNIDRASMLSDQVRLKVRKRNRDRHEYMKNLARDYVELKKTWKLGVKKLEKDRKRQDKLRLKQLQKQKLKNMSESGPIRTTNTNHQSPHVQQLVAAEKAAEAAGEGTIVRTSSRLTNNSSADLENNDLEKIEQAKAQALIDQEVRKKRLKNALSTVIPDMLITPVERKQRYFTRFVNGQSCMADGLVTDWKLKEKAEMKVNPWNDLEKCIYMDKFLQFPKNFPRISSFLSNKTTGDVIAFYYRTKKVADYKALLREQQLRRRGAGSKNTWSCWNLSACAAICLGVQFPEHVAKLLLHPSNFRSHQASDNILNSPGAQRLLRRSATKAEDGNNAMGNNVGPGAATEVLSALELVSGSDHTPTIRTSTPEVGVQLDDIVNSGDSDSSDEEKFNLYAQQLEQFIAGQQRPFLVDYASLLTDNSFSTGYEVSTLSVEERLKKYPTPSKELESASGVVTGRNTIQETAKGKQQSNAAVSNGNTKNGGAQMTKKELKQQRKMKKMQEGAAALAASPTTALTISQPAGNTGGEKGGNLVRKKNSAGSSATPTAVSGSRGTPRISIPGDEKVSQSGKKTSRGGGGTPGSRRNSQYSQANTPNTNVVPGAVAATTTVSITASAGGAAKKAGSGSVTPHGNAKASSPSSNTAVGSNNGNGGAPTKRVVQKWTEGEKADFLKYFSQYGKDWATLTENIPTKTAAQIKNYYQNYKNRLNLQDILKRRIENAASSGADKGAPTSGITGGNVAASPRSAAAGLMSGTLGRVGGLSMGMSSGSMAMSSSDTNMSFQAALNAAQPGMHGVNVLSELSANQFGMAVHQDQQQQSREIINAASNPERYLKLLNMQHQLQIMQFQQQQKSQGMTSESGGAGSNSGSYHEGQINAANAQRLYQFSRQQQQQHQVPPQHLSLQALQQMGLQAHTQAPTHTQMMQVPIQQQQQPRGSYAEMPHQSGMYQSMTQVQAQQHPQSMTAVNVQMSPTHGQQYERPVDSGANASTDGGVLTTRGNVGIASRQLGHHDMPQRSMMSMAMVNNTTGSSVSTTTQGVSTNSPRQPPLAPRSVLDRQSESESRQNAWQSAPATSVASKGEDSTANTTTATAQDDTPKGREALAPPAPPPVQPVRSRMSFSSILNESESPRDDSTPRGNGSMIIRQQESPRISEQQQEQEQQHRELMQQQRQPPLHIEHARAIPPSSAELARSPVSAPSPTAHLLPRRASVPTPHNRMGLMSSLLNVPSPERRTSIAGHQSPLMHKQQQMQRQMQPARYYDANASSAESGGTAPHGSIATVVSGMPASSTMSSAMARASPSEKMTSSASSMATYTNTSAQMAVALSRSGSASSTSPAVSNAGPPGDPRAQQQQVWNYAPQIRFEEAELLRRAQRAEEEAARAAAAAAAAARALQEAQQARQQALDMAANMARYNSAMQQQQAQAHQQQQAQQQHQQQAQQYQQLQQYQHLQAHHQQIQQQQHQQHQQHQQQHQQHEFHQQHQAQLHQQQMQHQALHHHLQLMQQQQQQRSAVSPSDHLLQQQMHHQQQPPHGPQSDR